MKQTLQLRLGQHLTMTPQLQQAIRLLQLSSLDLEQEVREALESNPLLETEEEARQREPRGEEAPPPPKEADADAEVRPERDTLNEDLPVDSEWTDIYDSYQPPASGSAGEDAGLDILARKSAATTLDDHLRWQLNLTPLNDRDRTIAEAVVEGIDEDGYLTQSTEDLRLALGGDYEVDEIEAVVHRVQSFDPPGVGGRDLRECLLIQLRQLPEDTPGRDTAVAICEDEFESLSKHDLPAIRRNLKLAPVALEGALRLLRSLNPRPGSVVAESEPQYVIPDVFVTRSGDGWRVELNAEALPRLRVNADYASLIRRADQGADNTFIKNHLQEARWFIKSLASRNQTVLRVATKIVELQRGFLEHGEEAMRPLVLRDVAEALEMHESTISRVTNQKYMHTPRGTFEFKYFFSSSVDTASGGGCSATAIRALVRKLIAAEMPEKPLSDNKIAQILGNQGIKVARRTIAKYRESMGIPPSSERKRLA